MAIGQKPKALQINRTPAPKQDLKTGGESYGQSNDIDTPASLPPGVGGPQSKLGQNLRESVNDPVADQILSQGVAGRGDFVPTDGSDQLRPVSAEPYTPSHSMRRQQADYGTVGKASLPSKLGASAAPLPKEPN
jgi:hypothetical protein